LEGVSPPRGWQTLHGNDPDRYLEQLAWYNAALRKDRYVWGAAIYCCGVNDVAWKSYDIWPGIAQRLAREARPIYRKVVPVPDRPLRRLPPTGPRRKPLVVARQAEALEPLPPLAAPTRAPDDQPLPAEQEAGDAAPVGLGASQDATPAPVEPIPVDAGHAQPPAAPTTRPDDRGSAEEPATELRASQESAAVAVEVPLPVEKSPAGPPEPVPAPAAPTSTPDDQGPSARPETAGALPAEPPEAVPVVPADDLALLEQVAARLDRIIRLLQG
jgi:hypothetical protein